MFGQSVTRAVGVVVLAGVACGGAITTEAARASSACNESAATIVPQPTRAQMVASGLGRLPVAPLARRIDLVAPPFSDSTNVTNPLFPISQLASVVLNGRVDGKAFRTETTLLPDTRIVEWSPGQCVKTLVSQYVAYLDGRVQEVALDFYAQADDGSVWYFGEEVYNYENGVVADTSGTWLAGKEGPAAMIMPANPRVGDVHRPENIAGLVWEEVGSRRSARPSTALAVASRERWSVASCTTTAPSPTSCSRPATASSTPRTRATSRRSRSRCPPTPSRGLRRPS
jgi:hypothetical protein